MDNGAVQDIKFTKGVGTLSEIFKGLPPIMRGRAFDALDDIKTAYDSTLEKAASAYELAHIDPLTGLFNKRGMEREVHARIDDIKRHGDRKLSLVVIDLDNFSEINNRLGHDQGDAALKSITAAWQNSIRKADSLCRPGGDEFVLLMSHGLDNEIDFQDLKKRIRSVFNDLAFKDGGDPILIGASIGIASIDKIEVMNSHNNAELYKELFRKADFDMYADKQNKVERLKARMPMISAPEMPSPIYA